MVQYIIYKLTRSDGKIYIGTTDTKNFSNRMSQHKSTERFRNHSFNIEIVAQSNDDAILSEESSYIEKFNSMTPNGLNLTRSGKGSGHNSLKFTTRGYRFSEESRKKMSEAAKRRCSKFVRTGWKHSDEQKKLWSLKRRGINARLTTGKKLDDVRSE